MIFTIISIAIALYALFNFKKAIMIFTIYQIFWYPTSLFAIHDINFGANLIIPFWFFILYICNKNKYKKCNVKNPYKIPFLLIFISYICSCFNATTGFVTEFGRIIMRTFSVYVYIWILWNTIEDEEDFKFLFKGITITMFIACIYGLIEYVTKSNPILDYKVYLSKNSIATYNMTGLRGYRLISVFEHPIGAGMTFGLYSIFYLSLWMKENPVVLKSKIGIITAMLCLPCIILTKMRTGILFTIILGMILLINFRKIKRKTAIKILILMIIISPIMFWVIKSNSALITNLITSETSAEIGGSSFSMRSEQFFAIKEIIAESPIFGLGETFREGIVRSNYTDAALGYEGLIFEQLSMHGYFGIFVNIIFIFYTLIIIPKKYKAKEVFFLSLAYWIAYLVSSIPSFRILLFYLASFYYIKTSYKYKNIKTQHEKGNENEKNVAIMS